MLGLYKIGRYIIVFGTTIWMSGVYLILGGYYSQGAGFIASLSITYCTFQNQQLIRNRLLTFQFLFYFLILFYVSKCGSLHDAVDLKYDEIVVLLGSIGWSLIMVYKFNRDRDNLLAELKTNNEELKETTEELERFTYIASHDLKSPLRTIVNFIGLIEKDLDAKRYDRIDANLSFVKSGAQQMNYLVQDILELSLLKGESTEKHEWINLDSALSKALANLSDTLKTRNAKVNYSTLPKYYGNEMEFLMLFQNIIENGIKYNKSEEPRVEISYIETQEELILNFKDNGIGIEEKYFDTIFKFFKRLHNSQEYKGTGLGLGLCNKIVNNYKGTLSVSSEIGKGSEFKISLPTTTITERQSSTSQVFPSINPVQN